MSDLKGGKMRVEFKIKHTPKVNVDDEEQLGVTWVAGSFACFSSLA